jgi:hypothetical protein
MPAAAENAELPLGDLEGLLMQISDNQRTTNSFQEFSASVPQLQLQLQHDDQEPWPNADMEEISVADYAASSGVADASECAGTELPFGDLEGLLLQLENDQENIEPLADADFSAPVPHHGFHQVCLFVVCNLCSALIHPLDDRTFGMHDVLPAC